MLSANLRVLRQCKEDIWLAELGALLHDVGKLHKDFLKYNPQQQLWAKYHHLVLRRLARRVTTLPSLSHNAISQGIDAARRALGQGVSNERALIDQVRSVGSISRRQGEVLLGEALIEDDFLTPALVSLLESSQLDILGEQIVVGDLIEEHAIPFFSRVTGERNRRGKLSQYLQHADFCDSSADKGDADVYQTSNTFVSTAFGLEKLLSPAHVAVFCKDVAQKLNNRQEVLRVIERGYREALGETRRCANDVTLWDHSYSVASLFKSAIASVIIKGWVDPRTIKWRLLRVNFDVLGLYAKAVHIPDLLGYQEAVERACEAVKRLVEEEYPLGNEVYRDTTGIYFTFPDIDLPAELEDEIRRWVEAIELELAPRIVVGEGTGNTAAEQLRTILADQREKARQELAWPFEPANVSSHWQEEWEKASQDQRTRWEICPVCRLRPMEEGKDACEHCWRRHLSGIQIWLSDPTKTIWLDEIADHNGRIALIVAKFGLEGWLSGDLVQTMLVKAMENKSDECRPKNPSPARLRRVWETCQRFWVETAQGEILAKHTYGQRPTTKALRCVRLFITPDVQTGWEERIPYDGTVAGQPVSLLWNAEKKHFVTIINLQLAAGEIKTLNDLLSAWRGQKAEVSDPDDPRKRLEFTIQQAIPAEDDFGRYRPYLCLLTSPDQFLALVPADDAPEIAEEIRQKYIEQMGKVQNRLPLFLGLVFFPRKTPLMAAMDTARRMLEQSVFKEEIWTVECVKPSDGDLKCLVRLSRDDQRLQYQVPIKMGDQTTPDDWYPYFFFEGDPGPRRLRFRHNGRWLVHVRGLQEGDRVHVFPPPFTYVFLEHTAQRFAFAPNRDVVLLDELPGLMDMWQDICQTPDMTDTKLQGIWRLFGTKWDLWKPDSDPEGRKTFEELVRATFAREGITCVTVEDVLTKRFQRCLELYLRVLKRRVKEEQNDQQPETV